MWKRWIFKWISFDLFLELGAQRVSLGALRMHGKGFITDGKRNDAFRVPWEAQGPCLEPGES